MRSRIWAGALGFSTLAAACQLPTLKPLDADASDASVDAAVGPDVNLLRNGSFESTGEPWPPSWQLLAYDYGTVDAGARLTRATLPDEVHSGLSSARVDVRVVGHDAWQVQLRQRITRLPQGAYRLTFSARAATPRRVSAYVHLLGSTPERIFSFGPIFLGATFQSYTYSVQVSFTQDVFVYFGCADSTESLWFDDVMLTRE